MPKRVVLSTYPTNLRIICLEDVSSRYDLIRTLEAFSSIFSALPFSVCQLNHQFAFLLEASLPLVDMFQEHIHLLQRPEEVRTLCPCLSCNVPEIHPEWTR